MWWAVEATMHIRRINSLTEGTQSYLVAAHGEALHVKAILILAY